MDQWWPKGNTATWTSPDVLPLPGPVTIPPINPVQPGTAPTTIPNAVPWSLIQKDPELAAQMLEVLKKLEAIDRKLGLLEQCLVAQKDKKKIKAKLRRIANKGKTKK
jgi:hypothetical protein